MITKVADWREQLALPAPDENFEDADLAFTAPTLAHSPKAG